MEYPLGMVSIEPFEAARWDDWASLMRSDSQCAKCWCLNHRMPAAIVVEDELARQQMFEATKAGQVHGLVAYRDGDPVGWLAVDPLPTLKGHDCYQPDAPSANWAIHCMYIVESARHQGLSRLLVQAAIQYATRAGCSTLLAYPAPPSAGKLPDGDRFSGTMLTYTKLGFTVVGDPVDGFYQPVQLRLS